MTNLGDRPLCPACGAQLRRGRTAGEFCDPCQRKGPPITLPAAFYDQPPLATALAGFDFATVFLAVRAEKRWSQRTLGEHVGMEQRRVSGIENNKLPLHDVRVVVRVANALAIPAGKLGFAHGTTVTGGAATGREGSWMDRRNFVGEVAGMALGVAGAAGVDVDRLISLLPQADPAGFRHIGPGDVEAIEQATAALRRQDFTHGSGMAREAAVTQLRATLPLLTGQTATEARPRLLLATADLATQAGWMSFDTNQHDAARRLWTIALNLAREADHPQGSDLTVYLLADMALQAVYVGRPKEALRLVHLGRTVAVSPSYPVSASTASLLANIQARIHAVQGDAADCDWALGQALDHFAAIDPATAPPWTAYLAATGVSGHQGAAHYTLALTSRDPHTAGRAVSLLRQSIDSFGPGYAALRAFYLPDLSGAHALAGDLDTAVTVGHQAIDAATALHSPQAHDRLHLLNTVLEPLHTSAGVAELHERLVTTAA